MAKRRRDSKGIIDVMDNFIPLISLLSSELEKKE